MTTEKQYAERDARKLDQDGNYYYRHVSAMTGEGLHSKSDIAAELAYRDMEIDRLRARLAEMPEGWIAVKDQLPSAGKKVLATFENCHGKRRTICGHYVPRWTIESSYEDDDFDEYSEEKDASYLREGWYENIENCGDFTSVHVCEGDVTHWMPLPAAPQPEGEAK